MSAGKYYSTLLLLLGIIIIENARAQVDPHTSQYYMNPLYLNPASAGIFDGDYRVSAVYRNQWRDITNAFTTVALTGEINTNKNINFGINILNQSAGDAGYNYMTGSLSIAYTGIRFSNNQHLSIGLNAGFINRNVDISKFKTGDQWNPITGYNPSAVSNDIFLINSSTAFDAGAGILYFDGRLEKKVNMYAGFSAFHLNKPQDSFLDFADKKVIPVRYAAYAGISLTLSDIITVVPNLLYMKQGNAQEKMAGAYVRLNVKPGLDILAGANYRFNDAVSAFAGFTYNHFTVGLSYDVNASDLSKVVSNANNIELTLSFTRKKKDRINLAYLMCPSI